MSPQIQVTQEEHTQITFLTAEANRIQVAITESLSRRDHCAFRTVQISPSTKVSPTDIHLLGLGTVSRLLDQRGSPSDAAGAVALLERLKNIHATTADEFILRNNGTEMKSLRFRLYNDRDEECFTEDSYIAMSYRWQSQTSISTNSHSSANSLSLPTSASMFQAVLNERRSKREGLWWDQACINQDDEEEKARSVGAMDIIYKSARAVIVALDDIEIAESEVSLLENYILEYEKSNSPPWELPQESANLNSPSGFSDIVKRILSSEYFERAWCDHELRLSSSAIFLIRCSCGSEGSESTIFLRFSGAFFVHMIQIVLSSQRSGWGDFEMHLGHLMNSFTQWTWGWFKRVAQQMGDYGRRVESLRQGSDVLFSLESLGKLGSAFAKMAALVSSDDSPSWASRRENFMTSTQRVFMQKAGGNPRLAVGQMRECDANRDKATIVLNTTGCGLLFRQRYLGTDQQQYDILTAKLRQHLLLLALAARDSWVLCCEGEALSPELGIVSWLHWPGKDSMSSTVVPPLPIDVSITVDPSTSCEYANLDLLLLHSAPGQESYHFASEQYLSLATTFFTEFVEADEVWAVSRSFEANLAERYKAERDLNIQLLACILECGIEWLASVGEVEPANTAKLGIRQSVETASLALRAVFGEELDRPPKPGEEGVNLQKLQAARTIFHFQLLLITFILQRNFSNRRWSSYCAVWFDMSLGRKALTIVPLGFRVDLSIPVALTADHYHDLPRCWLLQKNIEENCWGSLGKVRLFGGRHIEENQFWIMLKRQKVYQHMEESNVILSLASN